MVKILKIMDTNFTSQGLNGRVESIHNGLILVSCISSSMAHGEESFTKLPALSNSETFIRIYWMVNEGRGDDPSAWTYFGESHQYGIGLKLARYWPNYKLKCY